MNMTVKFEGANDLTLEELSSMGDDKYEFIVSDGAIAGVIVPLAE